jgi:NAD(P)-dependent dehydrogenase (short-subunit alcohol dehydrogenase family)
MPLNPPISHWSGQVVWLVGASSGIGQATAHLLHQLGAKIVVSARSASALQSFADQHPGALGLPLDVSDAKALHQAAQTITAQHGRIDLVVYCAGFYQALRATEFDLQSALTHQSVNYVGALYMLDAVLPIFLKQGSGHISLISSVAGYRGLPNALGYGPTKAALINLAQTLYLDLQPLGIGCSVINPGFVQTPMTAQNTFTMPALTTPETAAQEIVKGWAKGEFEIHFPKRFTRWVKILSHLSDALYFKLVRKGTGL